MNHDEVIGYDVGGIGDYGHTLSTISAELESVKHVADNIMGSVAEYFTTQHATPVYNDAHNMLMQGIEEGKETLNLHGQTVIQAAEHLVGTDMHSASSFGTI